MRGAATRFLPCLAWLRGYGRSDLRHDAIAGVTTAVMLIPQAMAYAMLAGLPPIVGLYAATVPLVAYAAFGTSRQLAVGPVAMDSLLVATGVGLLATAGTEHYVALAMALALLVGVIQLGLGLFRAGFLVNFLSVPVISGFTSAAAIIIATSQLEHLLGIDLPQSSRAHEVVFAAIARLGEVHLPTLLIGASAIGLLLLLSKVAPRLPRALVVVVLGTTAVWALGLGTRGVATVGDVPAGLPSPALPSLDLATVGTLLPTALTIAFVAVMEAISVSKAFARKTRQAVDPNQELVALGMANIAGGFFRGYPVAGGFSRTAVNAQAGARTPMAGLVTAAMVALTLLLFTPLFHDLPKAVLAAVIVSAVFGLVDVAQVKHLWRVHRPDLALLLITFFATLVLGIQIGIGVGVGASLLRFLFKTTRPHFAVLGRLPGTDVYRNVRRHPEAEVTPGVLVLRFDAQFYFGNISFLKATVFGLLEEQSDVAVVVIDASSVNQLDSSADAELHEIFDDLRQRRIDLHFASVKGPVLELMERSGFVARLGERRFHLTVHDAVMAASGALSERPPESPAAAKGGRSREVPTGTSLASDPG